MDSQTRKTKPKYEIIKEALLARIHAGDFSFDESLLHRKMLSEQHHVSRITAKRAIEDLEQQGILYRKRGVGSFVSRSLSPVSKTTDAPKMISLLLPFATTQGNISEAIGSLSAVLAECGYFLSIHVTGSSSPEGTHNTGTAPVSKYCRACLLSEARQHSPGKAERFHVLRLSDRHR